MEVGVEDPNRSDELEAAGIGDVAMEEVSPISRVTEVVQSTQF